MTKDPRYKGIKVLIETGNITLFNRIFEEHKFPVSTLASFLGTNYVRLTKYINNPSLFTFGEASRIAGYFEVDDTLMHKLIYENMLSNKSRSKSAIIKKSIKVKAK